MIKEEISTILVERLNELGFNLEVDEVDVEEPSNPGHGDFATNVALKVGSREGKSTRELAEEITKGLTDERFSQVSVAGPGFINFDLSPDLLFASLSRLLNTRSPLGGLTPFPDKRIQVEFVSSNPTGPLTVGHGRQAVLGNILVSTYRSLGYDVETEYYFNDEGRQIKVLAKTLWARYCQTLDVDREIPDDGYKGEYLLEIAKGAAEKHGEKFLEWNEESEDFFKSFGVEEMIARIKEDLSLIGVDFDNWFRESTLHQKGEVDRVLELLAERNATYSKDGAIWLKAEQEGAPKDVVLVKSNGDPTYLLPDIAYHLNKYERGFDRALVLLGADHQRHVDNMKAALSKLGLPEDFYQVLINQFVSLSDQGEVRRMSTREGEFVTLKDLVEDLGKDVVRYFMAARKPETHLEFDYELAKEKSMKNPVYYLQYAYTRIASIFRKARGADLNTDLQLDEEDLIGLEKPEEQELMKHLDTFPEAVEAVASDYGPHHLTSYGEQLASLFHQFYNKCRVLVEDEQLSRARLGLCKGVQLVLEELLGILGVSAPEEM